MGFCMISLAWESRTESLAAVVKGVVLASAELPYTAARCTPNLMVRFLEIAVRAGTDSGASPDGGRSGRVKENIHFILGAATSCCRTDSGNVLRPDSL